MTERDKHVIGVAIVVAIGLLFASAVVYLAVVEPIMRLIAGIIAVTVLLILGIHLAGWDEEDY